MTTTHRNQELDNYCLILGMNDSDLARALKLSRQTVYEWRKSGSLTYKAKSKIEGLHEYKRIRYVDKVLASLPDTHKDAVILAFEALVYRVREACVRLDYTADELSTGLNSILPNY